MKKKTIALIALIVILTCAVGGTLAWLVDSTGPVTNTFTPGMITCEINETNSGGVKSNVTVTNTGNVSAYIRAAIVINLVDSEGNVYAKAPAAGTDYNMTPAASGWTKKGDYYYYNGAVAASGTTTNLIDSITEVGSHDGYHLQVTVLAEAIQAEGGNGTQSAAENAWGHKYVSGTGWN